MLIKETIDTYKTFQGEQLYNTELEAPTSNEIESPINDTFHSFEDWTASVPLDSKYS